MPSDIIVMERKLLKSKAFRPLSGSAKTVYFDFRMKCRIKGGGKKKRVILNNGEIEYCYSEAEDKGIPRSTFMKAIDRLVEKGFIDIHHSGAGGKKGDKNLYGISERWQKYGTPNFLQASRPKDKRSGRGFKSGNQHWRKKKKQNIGVKNDNRTVTKNDNPIINELPEMANQ